MRLLLATDAWRPQVNGVVRTLEETVRQLRRRGDFVEIMTPDLFPTIACPWYQEIRLSMPAVQDRIEDFAPEHIHIATEGPIGLAVRNFCLSNDLRFTTSYHTDFPSYVQEYIGVPRTITYQYLRWFHAQAEHVMVSTDMVRQELEAHGFTQIVKWSRGVDVNAFAPVDAPAIWHKPLLVYMGRVAKEKNIEAFLRLEGDWRKRVVGNGPMYDQYVREYPDVEFTGQLTGDALRRSVAEADCFVFPSLTDTFGLVVLEALACGVPVAAYPTPGPMEILNDPRLGAVDTSLDQAVEYALRFGNREMCRMRALEYSWERCAEQFVGNLVTARDKVLASIAG